MFERVLVANRAEIGVRIIRSLRELDVTSVAIYSEKDDTNLHVRMADEAYQLQSESSGSAYLDIDAVLDVAERAQVEAIHPGYGFLSENAEFARACRKRGFTFIGPPADAIASMAEKTRARAKMEKAGVPVVPGSEDPLADASEGLEVAKQIGFPVLIKPALGGGGKGMTVVERESEFEQAFERAKRVAASAFGDDSVYLEKFIRNPKHVEIQILADSNGKTVHLFERDCSVQRRHQKIIEETPCARLDDQTRQQMGQVAVRAAEAVDYVNAGTVEFLLDDERNFYFLEMNTRLQVEHPVTEAVTGLDLVRWQVKIAAGEPFGYEQDELEQRGAAIECRIYAEDPEDDFRPCPGVIESLNGPSGPGIREDRGVYPGFEITPDFDPMISKLVAFGEDRDHARRRMIRALTEYELTGITSNLAFHRRVLADPDFASGDYTTQFVSSRDFEPNESDNLREQAELVAVFARHLDVLEAEEAADSGSSAAHSDANGSNWKRYGRFRRLGQF